MAPVLVLKGAAATRKRLSTSSEQGQNRITSTTDEEGKPWNPVAQELQHLKPEEILRKLPISMRQQSTSVTESAIGRALAALGFPIEPEFPVRHGRTVGGVEQRMAENVSQRHSKTGDNHPMNTVIKPLNTRMKAKLREKGGSHENLADLLGMRDLHEWNAGEFAEEGEISPVARDMRVPIMPESFNPEDELSEKGRDMALFDSEGKLRTKPRKVGVMRTLDPMFGIPGHKNSMKNLWAHIGEERRGRGKDAESELAPYNVWEKIAGMDSDKVEDILHSLDTGKSLMFNIDSAGASDGVTVNSSFKRAARFLEKHGDNETANLLRNKIVDGDSFSEADRTRAKHAINDITDDFEKLVGMSHDDLREIYDWTEHSGLSGGIRRLGHGLENYLGEGAVSDLPKFRDKLPPLSDYDAWAPSGKDMEKITGAPKIPPFPAGYVKPKTRLTEEGADIVEQLEAHRDATGHYKKFLDKMKLLGGIAEDPDQMRMFEFSNPAAAMLGRQLRESAKKGLEGKSLETLFSSPNLGRPPTDKYGSPWFHPLLVDNKKARLRAARTLAGYIDEDFPSETEPVYSDFEGLHEGYTWPTLEPESIRLARLGRKKDSKGQVWVRGPTGSMVPEKYIAYDAEGKMVDLRPGMTGEKFNTFGDIPTDSDDAFQEVEGQLRHIMAGGNLADLFGSKAQSNEAKRLHDHLVKKVSRHNYDEFTVTPSEADKLVAGWDERQKRMAFHHNDLTLDGLHELEPEMLPKWFGAPPDWESQGEASGVDALPTGPEPILPDSFNFSSSSGSGPPYLRNTGGWKVYPPSSGSPLFG